MMEAEKQLIEMTGIDVLRAARRIVFDGGDPDPCELGQYCLRCCIAIAKGDLDIRLQTGAYLEALSNMLEIAMGKPFVEVESDGPLMEAGDLLGATGELDRVHTKDSALALLDKVIAERRG